MSSSKTCVLGALAVVAALSAPLLAPPANAAPKKEPRPTEPMARIAQDIVDMQNDLLNSKMRLQRGIVGTSAEPMDPERVTPATSCCSRNLELLAARLGDIITVLDRLYVHYSAGEDADAVRRVAEVRLAIQSVGQGLVAFRNAKTEARANAALLGLIRPFNEMRAATESLAECCPVTP